MDRIKYSTLQKLTSDFLMQHSTKTITNSKTIRRGTTDSLEVSLLPYEESKSLMFDVSVMKKTN